jgi:hypothetical protein
MSEVIIMIAGRTEGIRWELDHAFSNHEHHKLIIIFPSTLRKNNAAALQWLTEYFSNTPFGSELLSVDLSRIIAIAFRDEGLLLIYARRIRVVDFRIFEYQINYRANGIDYYVALQTVICAINILKDVKLTDLAGPAKKL